MRKIKGFESFNESIMLQMINETALYFLPEIRSALTVLSKEGNDIADRLLQKVGVDTEKDITLVELEDDKLSFMTKGAIDSHDREFMQKLDRGYEISNGTGATIKKFHNRNKIKIGKFVTSILGPIPNKELEDFVNKIKSSKERGYEIKVVEGKEISKYYKKEALIPDDSYNIGNIRIDSGLSSSNLYRSCMIDMEKTKPNIFDIYTNNPESCKLVIMLDNDGKLLSRALLWKINISFGDDKLNLPDTFWFMDRVYSVKDWMNDSMQKFANKNNYAHKSYNRGSYITYDGVDGKCDMEVDVKKIGYKGFPYMDTFIYYDVKNGKLRNFDTPEFKGFNLQSTRGEYYSTSGYGPVFRNYIRRFIK